ncbi:MAG TPA: hypothetical protein VF952_17620 [Chloroflexia bacterium]
MSATAQAETLRKPGLLAWADRRIYTPRNPALALMLVVLGVYLLTMSGHTYSPDEETMLEVSRSLVTKGTWAIPESRSFVDVMGIDGRRYSQYGPGQSFAAVPWVAVGLLVGETFPKDQAGYPLRLILGTFNALVVVSICGLLSALGMALGYSRWASLLLGAALAFSTYLWPHSRTFFSEPLTALLMLGSFYLLVRVRHGPQDGRGMALHMVASGTLLALVLATKVQYAVVAPAFAIYLAWLVFSPRPNSDSPVPRAGSLASIFTWGLGFLLGLLPLMLYNWSVFGSPLLTGYGTDLRATFKTPLSEGVYGLLLSPGKGLVWYAPPVLLAAWGLWCFSRKHRAEAVFVLLLGASIVTLFALYAFWHGDGSWGPRYLIPLVPFAVLPAIAVFDRIGATAPLKSLTVAVVLSLGFFVNVLGVLVNFDTYINLGYDDQTRHFVPAASPIVGHYNLLGQRLRADEIGFSKPTGRLVLRDGFSYSEGDKTKGEMLPRWTTGRATMQIWPDLSRGTASVTLRLADHRPPELPRANLSILVNGGSTIPNTQVVPDMPPSIDYTFEVASNPATIEVQSDTWNPADVAGSERDEEIGLRLNEVIVSEGGQVRPYALSVALPAPPYYPQPRWYYDPGTPHPADLWQVYMVETGMGRKAMLALGGPIVLLALVCVFLGVRGLRGLRGRVALGAG